MSSTIIIRHARTTTNVRQSDSMDPELTDFGKAQATRVGKFLAKHVDLTGFSFHTSPFLRCLDTADRILYETRKAGNTHGCFVDERIREYINHCGREVTIPFYRERFPNMAWEHSTVPKDAKELFYKDEFNEELLNRLHDFHLCTNRKKVVITHGLPAFVLLHVIAHNANYVPIWDHSLDNCSITYIVNGRVIWHGRNLYHEVEHDPFDKARAFDAADLLVPKS